MRARVETSILNMCPGLGETKGPLCPLLCLTLLCGCAGTSGRHGVFVIPDRRSFATTDDVRVVLKNRTRESVYLDPVVSVPIGYCEALDDRGSWLSVGDPYDIPDPRGRWLDSIAVAPKQAIELRVDCELQDPHDWWDPYREIGEWLRGRGSRHYDSFVDAPQQILQAAIHGTFRVRVVYSRSFWHFQRVKPDSPRNATSKSFLIGRGQPSRREVRRHRSRWERLGLAEYTVYWHDTRESTECRGIFLEFAEGDLKRETGYEYGEVSEGCCTEDTRACLRRFEDLVDNQFDFLQGSVTNKAQIVDVEFDPVTGLPTQAVYYRSVDGMHDDRRTVLILVEPFSAAIRSAE